MDVGDRVYLKNEIEQSFLTNIILSPYRIISKKSTLLQDNKGNKFRNTQFMLESNKWVSETELVPFENIAIYLRWLYNEQYTKQLRAITNVFTYTNSSGKLHVIHPCCNELYWTVENALMETKGYNLALDAYIRDTGW